MQFFVESHDFLPVEVSPGLSRAFLAYDKDMKVAAFPANKNVLPQLMCGEIVLIMVDSSAFGVCLVGWVVSGILALVGMAGVVLYVVSAVAGQWRGLVG